MKAFYSAVILTVMIFLAGCQAFPAPKPSEIPAPILTLTSAKMIRRPTITAVTLGATWTPYPTRFVPTSTPEPTAIDLDPALSALLPECYEKHRSVNPDWIYGFCGYDETRFVNVAEGKTWSLSFPNEFNAAGTIRPVLWSTDRKYAHLSLVWQVDGGLDYINSWGLLRLELATGRVTETLSPSQNRMYALSFSPGGAYLAYVVHSDEPLALHLLDMHTGELQSFELPAEYHQAGAFLWSPDTAWLVYTQTTAKTLDDGNFSVAAINLADGSRQTVVPDQPLDVRPAAWVNAYTLRLVDGKADSWIYDFRDHSLKPR